MCTHAVHVLEGICIRSVTLTKFQLFGRLRVVIFFSHLLIWKRNIIICLNQYYIEWISGCSANYMCKCVTYLHKQTLSDQKLWFLTNDNFVRMVILSIRLYIAVFIYFFLLLLFPDCFISFLLSSLFLFFCFGESSILFIGIQCTRMVWSLQNWWQTSSGCSMYIWPKYPFFCVFERLIDRHNTHTHKHKSISKYLLIILSQGHVSLILFVFFS